MKKLAFILICAASAIRGGDDPLEFYRAKLDRTHPGNESELRELLDIAGNYRAFTHYLIAVGLGGDIGTKILSANWVSLIRAFEDSRLDKQIDTAPVASRATAPALLGVASESGALTRDARSNTLTFRGNADGIARFLLGQNLFPCCEPSASPLRNASFSVSLDPLGNQVTGMGVRYAILHARDVRNDDIKAKWIRRVLGNVSSNILTNIGTAYEAVETNPAYEAWLDRATALLKDAPAAELAGRFEAQLDSLALTIRTLDPAIDGKLADVLSAYDGYLGDRRDFFRDVTAKPALSAEYTQTNGSSRSLRVIGEANPSRGGGSITANGGLTIEGPLRRWDIAAQYDHPITASTFFTVAAGYDGTNFIAEAGITFRFAGSGVRLPIGLVWFDRNRGAAARFGISLDMDTLFMNPK